MANYHKKKPEWYPLPVYGVDLAPKMWLVELERRAEILKIYAEILDYGIQCIPSSQRSAIHKQFTDLLTRERRFIAKRALSSIEEYFFSEIDAEPDKEVFEYLSNIAPTLNIFMSDEELIGRVRSELENRRQLWQELIGGEIRPNKIDGNLKSWARNRVLQVFDTNIWNRLLERPMRQIELASIVWPEQEHQGKDLERKYRKSLKDAKLAIGVINRMVILKKYIEF